MRAGRTYQDCLAIYAMNWLEPTAIIAKWKRLLVAVIWRVHYCLWEPENDDELMIEAEA